MPGLHLHCIISIEPSFFVRESAGVADREPERTGQFSAKAVCWRRAARHQRGALRAHKSPILFVFIVFLRFSLDYVLRTAIGYYQHLRMFHPLNMARYGQNVVHQ